MKKKVLRTVLFIGVVFGVGIVNNAFADTYYVSCGGSDDNTGLSIERPFKTIQKFADISRPGDTVEIQPGTYTEEILITNSGTQNNPITYHSSGEVIINAQYKRPYCIKINGARYIRIEGFEICNATDNGILMNNSAKYNYLTDNIFHDNYVSGLRLNNACVHNVIKNNEFYTNGYKKSSYGNRASAIYLFSNSNDNTIDNNDIYNNKSGIWLEGCSSTCTITANKTYHNTSGGILIVGDTNNNVITNNFSYDNVAFGLELGYSAQNNLVKNNVICNNSGSGIRLNHSAINNIIKNNIITGNGTLSTHYGIKIEEGSSAQISYNNVYNNGPGGSQNYGGAAEAGKGDVNVRPPSENIDPQSEDFFKIKFKELDEETNDSAAETDEEDDLIEEDQATAAQEETASSEEIVEEDKASPEDLSSAKETSEEFVERKPAKITTVKCEDGEHSYAVCLPSRYEQGGFFPVLFCFDPSGNGRIAVERLAFAAEKYGWIVVGLLGAKAEQDWKVTKKAQAAMLKDVKNRFRVRQNNFYAAGFDQGARISFAMACDYNFQFKGVIACGAGFDGGTIYRNIAVYLCVGKMDSNLDEIREIYDVLQKRGVDVRLNIYNGGHSWPPDDILEKAVRWMICK